MTHVRRSRRLLRGAAVASAAALAAAAAPAALAASAVGHVSVTILPAAAGIDGGAMGFGTVGGSGAPGRASGPAAYSFGGSHVAGSVTLTGIPGTPVTLSLSAGDLAHGPGAPMPFRVTAASPGGVPVLDRSGALRLALAATLRVGAQQVPGAYRGSYSVTLDY